MTGDRLPDAAMPGPEHREAGAAGLAAARQALGPRQSGRYRRPEGAHMHLSGEDAAAAEALGAAVAIGTGRTSGLSGVALTRDERELVLHALWRSGWKLVPTDR